MQHLHLQPAHAFSLQVKKGDFVYDPFVGTGSILVAASHFGAHTFGADIDVRVVRDGMQHHPDFKSVNCACVRLCSPSDFFRYFRFVLVTPASSASSVAFVDGKDIAIRQLLGEIYSFVSCMPWCHYSLPSTHSVSTSARHLTKHALHTFSTQAHFQGCASLFVFAFMHSSLIHQ